MVISFEVVDARAAYDEALARGMEIAMEYKEEAWDQIHFMIEDPAGIVIDIVQHGESSPDG